MWSSRVLRLGHSVSVAVVYGFYNFGLHSLVSVSSVMVLMTVLRHFSFLYSTRVSPSSRGGGSFLLLASVGFRVLSYYYHFLFHCRFSIFRT